jgi:hypothetical protein
MPSSSVGTEGNNARPGLDVLPTSRLQWTACFFMDESLSCGWLLATSTIFWAENSWWLFSMQLHRVSISRCSNLGHGNVLVSLTANFYFCHRSCWSTAYHSVSTALKHDYYSALAKHSDRQWFCSSSCCYLLVSLPIIALAIR